jgi:hypothetical protein
MNWNLILVTGSMAIVAIIGAIYFTIQEKREAHRKAAGGDKDK